MRSVPRSKDAKSFLCRVCGLLVVNGVCACTRILPVVKENGQQGRWITRTRWTPAEDKDLRALKAGGLADVTIAKALGKTPHAIRNRAGRLPK